MAQVRGVASPTRQPAPKALALRVVRGRRRVRYSIIDALSILRARRRAGADAFGHPERSRRGGGEGGRGRRRGGTFVY